MDKLFHFHYFFNTLEPFLYSQGGLGALHRNGMHNLVAFTICMAREQKYVFLELRSDAVGIVLGSNLNSVSWLGW